MYERKSISENEKKKKATVILASQRTQYSSLLFQKDHIALFFTIPPKSTLQLQLTQ